MLSERIYRDLKWRILVNSSFQAVFLSVISQHKNVEFSTQSGDFVNVEDIPLGSSE